MDAAAIRRSLEGIGLRCTPQRYAVMAFLMECKRHPTAAEIFEAVNRVDPRSSRATTYNNLRDLVQVGLVREVAVEGRAARFDAKGMRHHHFICDRCGNVEDIEWCDVPQAPSASGFFANANSFSGGSARSALRGTLPVPCRRRVDTGLITRASQ